MRTLFTYSLASFLVFGFGAGAARAAEDTGALIPLELPAAVTADIDQVDPLDLRRWATATFHQDFTALISRLGEKHGSEKVDVLLDAAELYLSHMLIDEARSVLQDLAPITDPQVVRHRSLTDAVNLLGGDAADEFATSPLNGPFREDRSFWQLLQAIASADQQLLFDSFEQSFAGLGLQSRAVLRATLPLLTEVAIELERLQHAEAALRTMQELPGLAQSSTSQFLLGRIEEKRGNAASALEAYLAVSQGLDRNAVRARLALADMALREGSQGALLAAESTLGEGRESWRGGQLELEVFRRIVRVYEAMENDQKHLLTLGQMSIRFPNLDELDDIKQEADALFSVIYQAGYDGEIPLADWISLHTRLLPYFRTLPSFPAHTETMADYLAGLGATDLAAREYNRAISLLQIREAPDQEQDASSIARLHLKLAKTQLLAGLSEEARKTLGMVRPTTPEHEAEKASLKALVLADLKAWNELTMVSTGTKTPKHLRDLSKALSEEGKWSRSHDVLLQFWHEFPAEFTVTDAASLLVASNRSGDLKTWEKVIRHFPSLSENGPLVQLAKGMNRDMPVLTPLRLEAASARLERLEDALDKITDSQLAGSSGAVGSE